MNTDRWRALALCLSLAAAPAAWAQPPAGAANPPTPNDYGDAANWLCWPGAARNVCETNLATTVVKADGTLTPEAYKADPKAPIDCFYVYPTVSTDPGVVSTMAIEPQEVQVVAQQFARFGASCRQFAPVYRQFTLTALVAAMSGHPIGGAGAARPTTPYDDVKDAWAYYLAHENHGRGVVLIGHSQGSGVLTQLIKNEIDGKPVQARLVSAILMGTSLAVPKGAEVGGDFKSIPLCHDALQLGCVIAYASFRETSPPPANSRFGKPRLADDAMAAACVNPANLAGGEGPLHAYLATGADAIVSAGGPAPKPWAPGKTIDTPFVSVPGMLTARCVSSPAFNYLAVHVNSEPGGGRAGELPGDVIVGGQIQKDWGLHLIDANLAMGNLVDIVRRQGEAFTSRKP